VNTATIPLFRFLTHQYISTPDQWKRYSVVSNHFILAWGSSQIWNSAFNSTVDICHANGIGRRFDHLISRPVISHGTPAAPAIQPVGCSHSQFISISLSHIFMMTPVCFMILSLANLLFIYRNRGQEVRLVFGRSISFVWLRQSQLLLFRNTCNDWNLPCRSGVQLIKAITFQLFRWDKEGEKFHPSLLHWKIDSVWWLERLEWENVNQHYDGNKEKGLNQRK
jgi:hypothetical protein